MSITHLKAKEAPKSVRSAMETLLFSREEIDKWKVPSFQRPVNMNDKVRVMAEELKHNGGFISGVLTLGHLGNDKSFWIIDGQRRIAAFKISELSECIADVRILNCETLAEMAEEFVKLNSALVKMRPDDILRGLEPSLPALKRIREQCDGVGYGQVRRGDPKSDVMSMSQLIRCWNMSASDTPSQGANSGKSAHFVVQHFEGDDIDGIIVIMSMMRSAWGNDPEYYRLWGSLNVTMTMWLYRRLVINKERGTRRYVVLTPQQFQRCLMAVSANGSYLDWLVGRMLTDRDRGPCYSRLKSIFVTRLQQDTDKKVQMPQPEWGRHQWAG